MVVEPHPVRHLREQLAAGGREVALCVARRVPVRVRARAGARVRARVRVRAGLRLGLGWA